MPNGPRRPWSAGCLPLILILTLLLAACGSPPPPTPIAMASATPLPSPPLDVTLVTRVPATPAVLQITPTPTLTPTPTATPTPIVYRIQAGDTLLAIAIDHATTVDEILALNAGIEPRLLQIDQPLILPPPATPVFGPGGPTRIPLQVRVRSASVYHTPAGDLWLLGDLVNEGAAPAEDLQVGITLADATGTPLATAAAWVWPPLLAVGATGVFGVLVPAPATGRLFPIVSISAGQSAVDPGNRYTALSVSVRLATVNGGVVVGGEVTNSGEGAAGDVSVLIALYDEEDQVSGYQLHALPGVLAGGDTLPFEIALSPPGAPPVRVYATAFGLRAEAE